MITIYRTFPGQSLTPEQEEEVKKARSMPAVFDEDCEELSPEMIKSLKCAVSERNRYKRLREA